MEYWLRQNGLSFCEQDEKLKKYILAADKFALIMEFSGLIIEKDYKVSLGWWWWGKFSDLDLSFIAGFTAHWLHDAFFIGPDFIVIYLQAADIPAPHIGVVVVIFPHLLKIHDHIAKQQKYKQEFSK